MTFTSIPVSDDAQFVFTGPIDALFNFKLGTLPYRSLRFEYERIDIDSYQNAPVVAYPQEEGFTRITEFKKLPEQDVNRVTVIAKEYPQQYKVGAEMEPYYPILTEDSVECYKKYQEQASKYKNVILCGRLADYKYYNMDQVIRRVLDLVNDI